MPKLNEKHSKETREKMSMSQQEYREMFGRWRGIDKFKQELRELESKCYRLSYKVEGIEKQQREIYRILKESSPFIDDSLLKEIRKKYKQDEIETLRLALHNRICPKCGEEI